MSVKVDNLPRDAGDVFLYCWRCGEHYSATRGDYFWMPIGKPFVCRGQHGAYHRPVVLQLARQRMLMEVI